MSIPIPSVDRREPIRTCLGCGERHPQNYLLRFNLRNGKIVLLSAARQSFGRSIYLCPREGCFDLLVGRGRVDFKRSKHDRVHIHLDETEWFILKRRFLVAVKRRLNACD
ncbi:MAG: YlxR family protein [bacterium]